MLPIQLQEPEFRFILVKGKDKKPLEKDWTKTANYKFNDNKLLAHLQAGGNFGVACGFGNLLVVDFDNEELQTRLSPKLPSTFTVKSGGGLLHLYFKSNKTDSFKILDAEKNTLADIQGSGKQIIAPGSIHPNGNEYTVFKDEPLAFIDYSELQAVFSQWTEVKPVRVSNDDSAVKIKGKISVSEMLNSLGVNTSKNPTTCPYHASKGGKCLSFDDSKGVWHCFHCDQAGDVFNLYMLDKNCDFKTAVADLGKRCGITPQIATKQPTKALNKDFPTLDLITALKDRKPKEWIIKGLFPKKGILYLAGAPKTYKSTVAFYTALCLATSRDWFDNEKYAIQGGKKKVLIIQEENDEDMLEKFSLLAKGMDLSEEEALDCSNIFVSLCNHITIDSWGYSQEMAVERLKAKIEELQPDVVIFDSTVRMMEGDENSATDVRKIETTLKALMKDRELLCILLHHLTKKKEGMRGSGDFVAQADTVIVLNSNPSYNGKVFADIPYNRGAPPNFNQFSFRVYSIGEDGKRLTGEELDIDKIVAMRVGDFSTERSGSKDLQEVWTWITETNKRKPFHYCDIKPGLENGLFQFKERKLKSILAQFVEEGKLNHVGWAKTAKYTVPEIVECGLLEDEEEI